MNQQASIEELKPCREAFEQWVTESGRGHLLERHHGAWYKDLTVSAWWAAWHEAWNRRTSPSLAEVSSEGLPSREVIDALHEVTISLDNAVKQIVDDGGLPTPRLWDRLNKAKAVCAKNPRFEGNFDYPASDFKFNAPTSQQSPATAEGVLIPRETLENWANDLALHGVGDIETAADIQRALNQRLAVNDGKAMSPQESKAYNAGYSAGLMMGEEQGRRLAVKEGECKCDSPAACFEVQQCRHTWPQSTHPVSDDQQAKDAARDRWLREYPNNLHMDIYVDDGIGGRMVKRNNFLDEAIDASLSTTKHGVMDE